MMFTLLKQCAQSPFVEIAGMNLMFFQPLQDLSQKSKLQRVNASLAQQTLARLDLVNYDFFDFSTLSGLSN